MVTFVGLNNMINFLLIILIISVWAIGDGLLKILLILRSQNNMNYTTLYKDLPKWAEVWHKQTFQTMEELKPEDEILFMDWKYYYND